MASPGSVPQGLAPASSSARSRTADDGASPDESTGSTMPTSTNTPLYNLPPLASSSSAGPAATSSQPHQHPTPPAEPEPTGSGSSTQRHRTSRLEMLMELTGAQKEVEDRAAYEQAAEGGEIVVDSGESAVDTETDEDGRSSRFSFYGAGEDDGESSSLSTAPTTAPGGGDEGGGVGGGGSAAGTMATDAEDDGGYASDVMSTISTSITSSARDYAFENGRRYHSFREGRYNFPNDDSEQEREDMKHSMVKMLCQTLHFAPIGDHPHEVLDIGTGTGIWAIEFGDKYSSASVLGIDLSPIQPSWVPPNVRFVVDDAEAPWLHPRNHFDYVHARHTIMAIKKMDTLLRRVFEHLRPGGWVEFQEVYHFPVSATCELSPEHPVVQFWSLIRDGLSKLGVDFHLVKDGRLEDMVREAGFVNVTERVFHLPIGVWPKNRVLKTVGLYWRTILLDGLQAIALGPLTRGLGWSKERVELFLVDVRRAYHDTASAMYMPFHIVYGQKPPSHGDVEIVPGPALTGEAAG